jgi:hypothetical protein
LAKIAVEPSESTGSELESGIFEGVGCTPPGHVDVDEVEVVGALGEQAGEHRRRRVHAAEGISPAG